MGQLALAACIFVCEPQAAAAEGRRAYLDFCVCCTLMGLGWA